MQKLLGTLFLSITFFMQAQTKVDYLKNNRYDLNDTQFSFPETDFSVIGFGAYHGSAKTEKVELDLLHALTKEGKIKYYMPETDFSSAHYFNTYLKTGDKDLLKDLIENGTDMTPQDRTVETYEKWIALKAMNDALPAVAKLEVLGIDIIANYTFTMRHLVALMGDNNQNRAAVKQLHNAMKSDTLNMSSFVDSDGKKVLRAFVKDYEAHEDVYVSLVSDMKRFCHILDNVKLSLGVFTGKREGMIFSNYLSMKKIYDFEDSASFVRFGFFHLEKEREGGNASFFTRLIEQNIHKREDVISIIGFLTNSEVLWEVNYDENDNYVGVAIEGGFGIGDYEKEYFRGIKHLKATKISDKTLFKLNSPETPYSDGNPDLIEIIMTDDKSNGEAVKGKSTTAFMDYGVLISDSKANNPIEVLDLK
jgi:hypothetical protein